MLVTGLDGRQRKWKPKSKPRTNASDLHIRARLLLHQLYGNHNVLEEVSIKVKPKTNLYLDFYIPTLNLAVEVHGKQRPYHQNPRIANLPPDAFRNSKII